MTSTQVTCFLAAAQSASFSKAAEKIFVSQPTLGRNISALEQELGFPLFIRGASSNTLTEPGKVMFQGLSELHRSYEDLVQKAQAIYTGDAGKLSVGMLDGQFMDPVLSSIINRFRQDYPKIALRQARYGFRAMQEALRDGSLDIGISLTLDVSQESELNYVELCRMKNELIISADHPAAKKESLTLSDFRDEIFINIEEEESGSISALIWQTCRDADFSPNIKTVPDLKSQLFCVETGQGVAAFNQYHQAYNHPNLAHIPLPELPPVSFCAVWLRKNTNPAGRSILAGVHNKSKISGSLTKTQIKRLNVGAAAVLASSVPFKNGDSTQSWEAI